jgi:hypothetical protein
MDGAHQHKLIDAISGQYFIVTRMPSATNNLRIAGRFHIKLQGTAMRPQIATVYYWSKIV